MFRLYFSCSLHCVLFVCSVCQVIGMYDYTAQNDDELPFGKGQIINVLSREDPDWWKGELNGSVGLFPSNYVKLTTDTDPSQQCEYESMLILFVFSLFFCFFFLTLSSYQWLCSRSRANRFNV